MMADGDYSRMLQKIRILEEENRELKKAAAKGMEVSDIEEEPDQKKPSLGTLVFRYFRYLLSFVVIGFATVTVVLGRSRRRRRRRRRIRRREEEEEEEE